METVHQRMAFQLISSASMCMGILSMYYMESAKHHHQHNHIHDQHNLQDKPSFHDKRNIHITSTFRGKKRNSNVYVRISSSRGYYPTARPASIKQEHSLSSRTTSGNHTILRVNCVLLGNAWSNRQHNTPADHTHHIGPILSTGNHRTW